MSYCTIKTYEVSVIGYPPAPYSTKSAFHAVGWNGQYVHFVWHDSDVGILSHPLDVTAAPSLTGAHVK